MCQKENTIACRLVPLLFLFSIGISLFAMSPTLVCADNGGSKITIPIRDPGKDNSRVKVPIRDPNGNSRVKVPIRDPNGGTASLVTVQFNNFGASQSATTLFRGQPLDNVNTCFPAGGQPSMAGNVTGSGEFSVDFYSTPDCSGPRRHFFRFSINTGSSGTVTCNSDTDCQFVATTSSPA
jgi:hypothetical protein